jgi:hypothetical protein
MSMPEWFLNLPDEKKMQLAKKFAEDSPSDEIMTEEDVMALLANNHVCLAASILS